MPADPVPAWFVIRSVRWMVAQGKISEMVPGELIRLLT